MDNQGEPGAAIAIVGIACQFPGARDPAELHHLTLAGSRMFRPVPASHTTSGGTALAPTKPGRAALLEGWTVRFGEAPDPGAVYKLATETAAEALSDAGQDRRGAHCLEEGRRAGLIIASAVPDVCEVASDGFRIDQTRGFPPAAYLDSLQAISAACDTLRTGELDVVIAGGAELGVDPDWLARIAAAGELATGEMRVYDAEPTGLLPGDGCGVVVLMRSAQARAAGLPVYAEIAGWASALRADLAYAQASVAPGDVSLIEGHGAGTTNGDLAELTELTRLRQGSVAAAALGAISANIGQARSAAGVASLLKVTVAMVTGVIPPGTGCVRPHELIESGAARLRLPRAAEPWPGGVRLAAVSSLGPGGQAAGGIHLVLRRETEHGLGRGRRGRPALPLAPPRPAPPRPTSPGKHSASALSVFVPALPEPETTAVHVSDRAMPTTIFALCGAEPTALAAALDVVASSAEESPDADLRDLTGQMADAARRAAERGAPLRVTVTATGPRQLSSQARRAARLLRHRRPGTATMLTEPGISISAGATGTIALVFPGLATTVAEHATLLTASLNGLRLLDRLGVAADSAAGYGFGELAGLFWAGCLPASEAARLAALRGQVLRACMAQQTALARLGCDVAQASALCAASGTQIAVHETPGSYVLAGPSAAIRDLMRRAWTLGIPASLLAGGRAQHCSGTGRCAAPLRAVLADTVFGTPIRRLVSSITGLPLTPADDIAELLAAQPARPVLFAQALAQAVRRPGRPPADLIVVTGPTADPAAPAAPAISTAPLVTPAGQPPSTLAAIATAASGQPAIALPPIADLLSASLPGPSLLSADLPGPSLPGASLPGASMPGASMPGASMPGAGLLLSRDLPGTGLPGTGLTGMVAALFTAGAITDLTPFLFAPHPDLDPVAWAVPPMRDASPAETSGAAEPGSTVCSSTRKALVRERPRQLPVGPQRHACRPIRMQPDAQHLVKLDLVPVEAEP